MFKHPPRLACLSLLVLAWALTGNAAAAATPLTVAYAGSMGAVMDKGLGPAFDRLHGTTFQGIGQGAYGLARQLAAKQLRADVFVSITAGPVGILQQAGLLGRALPIASTQMVIAYSPRSRFAARLAAASRDGMPWYEVLQLPGLRFGRTDPATDPQGRNIVFTMLLAQRYYDRPGLARKILGPVRNPAQIFTEPSLLSRLEAGQIDASSGYLSAAVSHRLPYIRLPAQINLSDPAMVAHWYATTHFDITLPNGRTDTLATQPLVFYAGVMKDAAHPRQARRFIAFLRSAQGQRRLQDYGYSPPMGNALEPSP
ncbi:MAG: substrate-binding domain-containing protein [Pseudomonadota bacterium]|nr:substrate-binding domain-containing protein [Pseudomonadota bacterium]